ncbi:hypothetical protein BGW42_007466 [Actinomortierella wolfii]|nr:hypothetical protein BGW42_007466 [Actinomortierella wolfii]
MSRPNKDHQAMQNSRIKIEFLTRYTDRMRLKLEALGIEDWRVKDIQRKKTYRMMIQQNDRSGESELYGGDGENDVYGSIPDVVLNGSGRERGGGAKLGL